MVAGARFQSVQELIRRNLAEGLETRLAPCANCEGEERVEVVWSVLSDRWVARCECGIETGGHDSAAHVVTAWNAMQRAFRHRLSRLRAGASPRAGR